MTISVIKKNLIHRLNIMTGITKVINIEGYKKKFTYLKNYILFLRFFHFIIYLTAMLTKSSCNAF